MTCPQFGRLREEHGVAVLIAVIVLLLLSAIGIAALQHSQDEFSGAGRARRKTTNRRVAEAGLRKVYNQLLFSPAGAIDQTAINTPNFMTDSQGNPIRICTDGQDEQNPCADPDPIEGPFGINCIPEGGDLRVAQYGGTQVLRKNYRANILALDQGGGIAGLQAQFCVLQ